MGKLIAAAGYVMRLAWRTGPLALLLTFGEIVSTVLRFIQPLLVGLVVDGLTERSADRVVWGAALLVVSLAFGGVLEAVAVGHRVKLIEDIGYAFDLEVMGSLARIDDLDRLEQPRLAAAVARARDRAGAMGFCFNGVMSVLIQAAAPVSSIVVAMVIDPRLLLLAVGGIPAILVSTRVAALSDEADEAAQPHMSRAAAWAALVSDGDARAERKVFRLWPWYRANLAASVSRRDAAFLRPARFDCVGSILAELCFLAVAALTVWWVLASRSGVSAGAIAAALLVSLNLRGALGALRFALSGLGPSLRGVVAMREVRSAAETGASTVPGAETGASAVPAAERGASTVPAAGVGVGARLDGVSYQHAAAEVPALRAVDLAIEPGQVIAVVGANGAGKSTLVELLLGLRRPTGGRAVTPAGSRSAIAQTFGRYEFTLAESVALADRADLAPDRVSGSLARAASSWSRELDTQLGTRWPDGTDLSGGQWQSVAAARCFYVPGADLMVLDEPTAALDPEAQEAMTARYATAAREVAARGGIAVLITHRMSMPRLADRILVLHQGEIVESGTHETLLASDGRYAKAYRAQVAGFLEMTDG